MARVLLVYPNQSGIRRIVPSLAVLAASLKRHGHEVALFDTTFYFDEEQESNYRAKMGLAHPESIKSVYARRDLGRPIAGLKAEIERFRPDMIGITLIQDNYYFVMDLVSELGPGRPFVVLGGVLPSLDPAFVLKGVAADAVIVGEGEVALPALADLIGRKEAPYAAPNLVYRSRDGGLVKNPLASLLDPARFPPYDLSIFDDEHFYRPFCNAMRRMAYLELTRGCPYQCTYCANKAFNQLYKGRLRRRPVRAMIEEACRVKAEYRTDLIMFVDENFLTLPEEETLELCRLWSKRVQLPFIAQSRAEEVCEAKLQRLKDAGLTTLIIGLETGDETFRRRILNRHYSNATVIQAFEHCRKAGLRSTANSMLGLPHETEKELIATVTLNREVNPSSVAASLLFPFKGCDLYDLCVREGLIVEGIPRLGSAAVYETRLSFPEDYRRKLEFTFNNFHDLTIGKSRDRDLDDLFREICA